MWTDTVDVETGSVAIASIHDAACQNTLTQKKHGKHLKTVDENPWTEVQFSRT